MQIRCTIGSANTPTVKRRRRPRLIKITASNRFNNRFIEVIFVSDVQGVENSCKMYVFFVTSVFHWNFHHLIFVLDKFFLSLAVAASRICCFVAVNLNKFLHFWSETGKLWDVFLLFFFVLVDLVANVFCLFVWLMTDVNFDVFIFCIIVFWPCATKERK